jgi:hypothetical protein
VAGSGFGATETVVIDFDTKQVAKTTTDPAGSFSKRFKVSKSALPGNHTVTATGKSSGYTAMATFLVRTNWSQFRFDAAHTGFNPHENVISPQNVSTLTEAWTLTRGRASGSHRLP